MGLTRDDRGVATYTVDDAPTRNALGTAALGELDQTLADLAADSSVRVVVLTGAGTVFSSGADRSELGDPALIESSTRLLSRILTRIEDSPARSSPGSTGRRSGPGWPSPPPPTSPSPPPTRSSSSPRCASAWCRAPPPRPA